MNIGPPTRLLPVSTVLMNSLQEQYKEIEEAQASTSSLPHHQ